MSTDRHVSWMCQIVDSERPWSFQCHALMQMILGIAMRIMQKKKKKREFTIGRIYNWLFHFQSNDFQSKGIE